MPPFVDDPVRYPNDARLIRILRDANWWQPKDAPTRASSLAFFDTQRENSCLDLDQLTDNHFRKIQEHYPHTKIAVITACDARAEGYSVCDDPADFLPGHVVVCPPRDTGIKEYRRMASKLALRSTMYLPPSRP